MGPMESDRRERFLSLVGAFMARGGKEFNRAPQVGDVTLDLAAAYALVARLGGLEKVLAAGTLQGVAAKLGITSKHHLNDFVHAYYAYLYPFEQYAKSAEGARELQSQMAQGPQGGSQAPPGPIGSVGAHAAPPLAKPMAQPAAAPSGVSPGPPPAPPIQLDISNNISWDLDPTLEPAFLKEYFPFSFYQERTNGVDLAQVDLLGSKLDDVRPVYLYLPELGAVDVRALALALESSIDAEVNNALNQLLIVTTDEGTKLDLGLCPELLDALCGLGVRIIRKLAGYTAEHICAQHPVSLQDRVFQKYVGDMGDVTDVVVTVDSFTGKPTATPTKGESEPEETGKELKEESLAPSVFSVSTDAPEELSSRPASESPSQSNSSSLDTLFGSLAVPSLVNYTTLIHQCMQQANALTLNIDPDAPLARNLDIHSKSWASPRIMHMEQLSTLSLIVRNLSFTNNNNLVMGKSALFLNYLMSQILLGISGGPASGPSLLARKRLMLLKDALIVLTNTAHVLTLSSELHVWIVLCLAFTFGPERPTSSMATSSTSSKLNKYHPHAIDVVLKMATANDSNYKLLSSLVRGTSHPLVARMASPIYGSERAAFEHRGILKHLFSLFLSALPLNSIHQGVAKFNDRPQLVLEALIGSLLLLDIVEDDNKARAEILVRLNDPSFDNDEGLTLPPATNVALHILTAPENLGMILNHLCFMYACVFVNGPPNERRNDQVHISARAIELVNKMVECAIHAATTNLGGPREHDLAALAAIPNLFGSTDHQLGMLMTLDIPQTIILQVTQAFTLEKKLQKLVK